MHWTSMKSACMRYILELGTRSTKHKHTHTAFVHVVVFVSICIFFHIISSFFFSRCMHKSNIPKWSRACTHSTDQFANKRCSQHRNTLYKNCSKLYTIRAQRMQWMIVYCLHMACICSFYFNEIESKRTEFFSFLKLDNNHRISVVSHNYFHIIQL